MRSIMHVVKILVSFCVQLMTPCSCSSCCFANHESLWFIGLKNIIRKHTTFYRSLYKVGRVTDVPTVSGVTPTLKPYNSHMCFELTYNSISSMHTYVQNFGNVMRKQTVTLIQQCARINPISFDRFFPTTIAEMHSLPYIVGNFCKESNLAHAKVPPYCMFAPKK